MDGIGEMFDIMLYCYGLGDGIHGNYVDESHGGKFGDVALMSQCGIVNRSNVIDESKRRISFLRTLWRQNEGWKTDWLESRKTTERYSRVYKGISYVSRFYSETLIDCTHSVLPRLLLLSLVRARKAAVGQTFRVCFCSFSFQSLRIFLLSLRDITRTPQPRASLSTITHHITNPSISATQAASRVQMMMLCAQYLTSSAWCTCPAVAKPLPDTTETT